MAQAAKANGSISSERRLVLGWWIFIFLLWLGFGLLALGGCWGFQFPSVFATAGLM
jgi:hypothetical protein